MKNCRTREGALFIEEIVMDCNGAHTRAPFHDGVLLTLDRLPRTLAPPATGRTWTHTGPVWDRSSVRMLLSFPRPPRPPEGCFPSQARARATFVPRERTDEYS